MTTAVIYCSQSREIATEVATILGYPVGAVLRTWFADGEMQVSLPQELKIGEIGSIAGVNRVIIVQSLQSGKDGAISYSAGHGSRSEDKTGGVNDNLMELLLALSAAKHAAVREIIACVPYMGYSRQATGTTRATPPCAPSPNLSNSLSSPNFLNSSGPAATPISAPAAELVFNLMRCAGAHQIITLDLHDPNVVLDALNQGAVINLSPALYLAKQAQASRLIAAQAVETKNLVVVSPDAGGKKRAAELASYLQCPFVCFQKQRTTDGRCHVSLQKVTEEMEVNGRTCLLVDDMVDSGNTIAAVVAELRRHGAQQVGALITHLLLGEGAIPRLEAANLDYLVAGNSIAHSANFQLQLPGFISVISLAPVLAAVLRK